MLEVRLSCFVRRILAAPPQKPGREQALYQIGLPKSECWRPLHESAPNQSRIQGHMPKQHQNCRTAGLADYTSCHFEEQVERRRQEFMASYLSISFTFRLHRLKKTRRMGLYRFKIANFLGFWSSKQHSYISCRVNRDPRYSIVRARKLQNDILASSHQYLISNLINYIVSVSI